MPSRKKTSKKQPSAEANQPPIRIETVVNEGVPTFYVNNAKFIMSAEELRIDFGQILERDAEANKIVVHDTVRLYMSWPHAGRFLDRLRQNVHSFNEQMQELIDAEEGRKSDEEKNADS